MAKKALKIYKIVANYLERNEWYRDADDPAIWVKDGKFMMIGDALEIQLRADGLKWPYV
jgi:hypothetical protein